jgi:hypothetical protein
MPATISPATLPINSEKSNYQLHTPTVKTNQATPWLLVIPIYFIILY